MDEEIILFGQNNKDLDFPLNFNISHNLLQTSKNPLQSITYNMTLFFERFCSLFFLCIHTYIYKNTNGIFKARQIVFVSDVQTFFWLKIHILYMKIKLTT